MKTPLTQRPKSYDETVVKEAAEKLLPDVIGWLGDDGTPESEVLEDLIKALRYGDDGYEIAKSMDGNYSPDAALVEILDSASSHKRFALEKACKEWVAAEGLDGPEIGANVTHSRSKDAIGTVMRNWPDGRSTVAFPELGHVTEGTGCHGLILEWETLIPQMNVPVLARKPAPLGSDS
jgi:hypothetical protein